MPEIAEVETVRNTLKGRILNKKITDVKVHYKNMIEENPNWEFVGIYADEGISGTQVSKREEFLRMIEQALPFDLHHFV